MRFSTKSCLFFLLLLSISVAAPLHATPIVWTLQNIVFSDAATATGSFTYDTSTGYSDWNISVGSGLMPSYNYLEGYFSSHVIGYGDMVTFDGGEFSPSLQHRFLRLDFADPLPDTGGAIIDLLPSRSARNGSLEYYSRPEALIIDRYIIQGSVFSDGVPVPEPSTFLLLGGGLAGLAFVARRRRKE